jgi:hypothetical protein
VSAQVPLPIGDRVRHALETSAAEIRAALRTVAKRTKQGEVLARGSGMDAGNLSKALKGERQLDVDALPAFFAADEEGTLIRLLCRLNRGQFVPDPEITPEQRLENVLRACRQSGSAGAAILRDAGESP